MSDRELLELIAAQVGILTKDVAGLKEGQAKLSEGQISLKEGQARLEKTVLKIEHEHGEKLQALIDFYKQNSDQLNRIENKVSKH